MYLFTRTTRLGAGQVLEAMAWAVGMAERVKSGTDLEVQLWSRAYSEALGTVSWSTFVPDLAVLETANEKLVADDGYVAGANAGAAFTLGGIDDALYQVIHGEPDPERNVRYVASVQSACANGHLSRGMELGVELAERAEAVTGIPTMFVTNMTGVYGGVGWLSGFETIDEYATFTQALVGDAKWVELIDKRAGKAYTDDASATTQVVWRRVV